MPFFRWDEMEQKSIAKPSQSMGSLIVGDHITLNRSVSKPGKVAEPHFHGCEQLLNVVSGQANFRVGDEEKVVKAGDIVHIPIGTEHAYQTIGDEDFVYLSFKNISEDWPPASD